MERENRTTEEPKNLINVVPLKLAGFFKHHLALQNNMFAASDLNVFMPIFFAVVGKCISCVPSVTAPILQHPVFRRVLLAENLQEDTFWRPQHLTYIFKIFQCFIRGALVHQLTNREESDSVKCFEDGITWLVNRHDNCLTTSAKPNKDTNNKVITWSR